MYIYIVESCLCQNSGGRDGVNVDVDDESWHCRSLAELKVVMNLLVVAVVEPSWQMAEWEEETGGQRHHRERQH